MKCDIIIPVWNEPKFTRECIERIVDSTHYPYRIIVIDNGSDEQTKRYLEGLKERDDVELSLIRNEENQGFIRAANQGVRMANAPYVCLLNNDTLVTEGWLTEMVDIAEKNSEIGILNPSSNTLGQRFKEDMSLEAYASSLKSQKGQWGELGSAVGFCMLIKRELVEKLGLLDEAFGMGNFEDTDYCRRAQQAGYKCVRAKGAYVFHRENTSFKRLKDWNESFRRNQEIFYKRWGRPLRIAWIVHNFDDKDCDDISRISLDLAKRNNLVWLIMKNSLKPIDMEEHSYIKVFRLSDNFFYWTALFKILKRRKKRFDALFADNSRFINVLKRLKFFHKADIICSPNKEKVDRYIEEKKMA